MPVLRQPIIIQLGKGDILPTLAQKEDNSSHAVTFLELKDTYEVGTPVTEDVSINQSVAMLEFTNIESLEVVMGVLQQLHDKMKSEKEKVDKFTDKDIPMWIEDGVLVFNFDIFFHSIDLVNPQQMSFPILEHHLTVLMQHVYAQHVFATVSNLPQMRKAMAETINVNLLNTFIVKKGGK